MLKKIEWTKKRIIILIACILAFLAVVAGTIFAIWMLSDDDSPTKKIIKKVIVVQNEENDNTINSDDEYTEEDDFSFEDDDENNFTDLDEDDDSSSDDDDDNDSTDNGKDDNSSSDNDKGSFLINIKKIIRSIFSVDVPEEEETVYMNSSYPKETIYAKDFGVVGDGKTDDAKAVYDAIIAISNCGPGSTLIFEKDSDIYCKNVSLSAVIRISQIEGITIDGNGSTIWLDTLKEYANITSTKDCVIKNFNFDYVTKPAFTALAYGPDPINTTDGTAVMQADRDIGLETGETYIPNMSSVGIIGDTGTAWWGVLNRTDSRYHMRIKKYEMIDREKRIFKIYFADANTINWSTAIPGNFDGDDDTDGMICPMPYWGHMQERGFSISENTDLKLKNLDVHSCARFGMYIGRNEGSLLMDDVDFVPADNDLDRNIDFTSWRDTFHCKDNRCSIKWINCDATGNYDDIFNVSSSTLYVSDYNLAKNRVTLVYPQSANGIYYTIKAGDTLNIIDTDTGMDIGTATIKRVVRQQKNENIVILDKPLNNLSFTGESIFAFFTNRCAPKSEIINCNFSGTYRFRGPITISNSYFYNQRTWIEFEDLEGPIPKDILFKNCTIKSGRGATIIIGANSGIPEGYHAENIKFENCKMDSATLDIYESDLPYVKLIGCTEHDGTAIPDRK